MTAVKRKSETLELFADLLFKANPLSLNLNEGDDYQAEALTILARFNEAGFQVADSSKDVLKVGLDIVTQAFEFWFSDELSIDYDSLTRGLVDIYLNSYGVTLDDLSKAAPEASGGPDKSVEHVMVG